jgi:hypothetical protein
MQAAPKSKYESIIRDLNVISNELCPIEEFTFKLQPYKTDAKKMIQSDPENAYILLGIIACIKMEIDSMHKYHKLAIKCSSETFHSFYQYCCSLSTQGLHKEAYEYALLAHEKIPEDKNALEQLLNASYYLKMADKYTFYKTKLQKLNFNFLDPGEFPEDNEGFLKVAIPKIDEILETHPELIIESDPALEAFVDELLEGVDI